MPAASLPTSVAHNTQKYGVPLIMPVIIIIIMILIIIIITSGDESEGAFPFQRFSVLVQRYNAVLLHDTLPAPYCMDWRFVPN